MSGDRAVPPPPQLTTHDAYSVILLMIGPPPWFAEGRVRAEPIGWRSVDHDHNAGALTKDRRYEDELKQALRTVIIDAPDITRAGFLNWYAAQVYGVKYI